MRLAFRLFSALLLLEMMCLYHCFGQEVSQVSYPTQSSKHFVIDQLSPADFTFMDLVEFLEGKDGNETPEEDSLDNDSSDQYYVVGTKYNLNSHPKKELPTQRLLNFKKNTSPLFVLFHSWKYHLA